MKKLLKAVLAVALVVVLFSSQIAFCEEQYVPLYEKYRYDENFDYEDEYIAYALKSTVVCIRLIYEAEVEYFPVIFNLDTIDAYIDELYTENSDTYDRDEIAQIVYEDMQVNIVDYLEWGNKKTVELSLEAQGSGVVIGEDGHIATNAHVVGLDDVQKEEACLEYLLDSLLDDLYNVAVELEKYDIYLSDDQLEMILDIVIEETQGNYDIDAKEELYVCFPSESGDTDIDEDRVFKAKILEKGVAVNVGNEGVTQDAAILKIKEDNLVSLALSPDYPEQNSKIITAGFPVAAERIFAELGSGESTLSVSIGTGNVSRLIPVKGHDYKALEITTTISGGNSGGPSVDKNLKIEGLNTYGLTSDMRYAYMIPAEYVAELAEDIDCENGELSKNFLTAIQLLQNDHGAAALECLLYVQDKREETPYIENLIELAQKAPQTYPEGTGPKTRYVIDYNLVFIIGGPCLALAIALAVIIIVVKKKRASAKQKPLDCPIIPDEIPAEDAVLAEPIETETIEAEPVEEKPND